MFLRSVLLGATTAFALRANALLVVPESEPSSSGGIAELGPVEAQDTQQQLIDLPCTECPFPEVGEDGDISWTDGFKTSLVRLIIVAPWHQMNRMDANDVPVFELLRR